MSLPFNKVPKSSTMASNVGKQQEGSGPSTGSRTHHLHITGKSHVLLKEPKFSGLLIHQSVPKVKIHNWFPGAYELTQNQ